MVSPAANFTGLHFRIMSENHASSSELKMVTSTSVSIAFCSCSFLEKILEKVSWSRAHSVDSCTEITEKGSGLFRISEVSPKWSSRFSNVFFLILLSLVLSTEMHASCPSSTM